MTIPKVPPQPVRRGPSVFKIVAGFITFIVCILIVGPLVITIPEVFSENGEPDFSAFGEVWNQAGLWEMLGNTIFLVVATSLIAVAIAAVFAWLNERTTARIGWLSETLPIIPMLVPSLAGTIGWILLAEPGPGLINNVLRVIGLTDTTSTEGGPLNIYSWSGLIFVSVLNLVPHAYLVIAAALRNVDPSLEEASRDAGASELRTLRRITLPAIGPAIASGALLVMVMSFALYSVPILIGTGAGIDVLAVRVVRLAVRVFPPELGQAFVLGLVMLLFIGTMAILQRRLSKAGHHATVGGKFGGGSKVDLGRVGGFLARFFMLFYPFLTAILPLIALFIVSLQPFWSAQINWSAMNFDAYERIFSGNGRELLAIRNSVTLALVGATIAILVAALIDVFREMSNKRWVNDAAFGITRLPGVVSNILIALAILATLAGPPFNLGGTLLILLIGYIVLYLPQASVSSESALAQIDRSLVEASRNSGASEFRTFFKVQLPLMIPGLTAGWVFLFVLMAGDLTGSVMLVSTRTPVIGTVTLDTFESGSYPIVAALSVVASVIPAIIVIAVLTLTRRMQERRGRGDGAVKRARKQRPAVDKSVTGLGAANVGSSVPDNTRTG
ncbi:iron ABC transporter permease [Citricoccus sp. NPDC055426]|uniref:ABC transporter permease n=1 Tax=Citricoccus sp. NPDC055426 TaxID=3155536 RepID=UPI00342626B1